MNASLTNPSRRVIVLCLGCILWLSAWGTLWAALLPAHERFLQALHQIEASGKTHPLDGDGGRAIGPFQIHYRYWRDAVQQDPVLRKQGYQKCRDYAYARKVVCAYMRRHAAAEWAEGKWKKLARIHNGGPEGCQAPETSTYATRVINVMNALK